MSFAMMSLPVKSVFLKNVSGFLQSIACFTRTSACPALASFLTSTALAAVVLVVGALAAVVLVALAAVVLVALAAVVLVALAAVVLVLGALAAVVLGALAAVDLAPGAPNLSYVPSDLTMKVPEARLDCCSKPFMSDLTQHTFLSLPSV
jgi:hypothetical protein